MTQVATRVSKGRRETKKGQRDSREMGYTRGEGATKERKFDRDDARGRRIDGSHRLQEGLRQKGEGAGKKWLRSHETFYLVFGGGHCKLLTE